MWANSSHSTFCCIKTELHLNSSRLFLLLHLVLLTTSVSNSATPIVVFHSPAGFSIPEMFFFLCRWSLPVVREVTRLLTQFHREGLVFVWELLRESLCLSCQSPVELFLLSLPFWAASVWLSGARCRRGLQCTLVWFCWPDWPLLLFSFRISSGCLTSSFCGLELKLWSFSFKRKFIPVICWRSAGDRQTFQTQTQKGQNASVLQCHRCFDGTIATFIKSLPNVLSCHHLNVVTRNHSNSTLC